MRGWAKKIFKERHLYFFRKRKNERYFRRLANGEIKRGGGISAIAPISESELTNYERKWVSIVGEKGYVPPDVGLNLKLGSLIIRLPEVFDFEKNYDESAQVVGIFRKALIRNQHISYIDFSSMKEISSPCIMVFTCYADLWKRRCKIVSPRTETWYPWIQSSFHQIGFFKILNLRDRHPWNVSECHIKHMGLECHYIEPNLDNVGRVLNEITGNIQHFVDEVNPIRCELNRISMYQSFTEAVTNVYHHAYPRKRMGNLDKKWWLSVSYDSRNKELCIIVFDHGVGIPETIARNINFSRYKKLYYKFVGERGQKERLFIAFEHRRTSKGGFRHATTGRGHGCSDILKYLSEGKGDGSLYVVSDRAKYFYSTKNRTNRGAAESLPMSINGTLIEWRICL